MWTQGHLACLCCLPLPCLGLSVFGHFQGRRCISTPGRVVPCGDTNKTTSRRSLVDTPVRTAQEGFLRRRRHWQPQELWALDSLLCRRRHTWRHKTDTSIKWKPRDAGRVRGAGPYNQPLRFRLSGAQSLVPRTESSCRTWHSAQITRGSLRTFPSSVLVGNKA